MDAALFVTLQYPFDPAQCGLCKVVGIPAQIESIPTMELVSGIEAFSNMEMLLFPSLAMSISGFVSPSRSPILIPNGFDPAIVVYVLANVKVPVVIVPAVSVLLNTYTLLLLLSVRAISTSPSPSTSPGATAIQGVGVLKFTIGPNEPELKDPGVAVF